MLQFTVRYVATTVGLFFMTNAKGSRIPFIAIQYQPIEWEPNWILKRFTANPFPVMKSGFRCFHILSGKSFFHYKIMFHNMIPCNEDSFPRLSIVLSILGLQCLDFKVKQNHENWGSTTTQHEFIMQQLWSYLDSWICTICYLRLLWWMII